MRSPLRPRSVRTHRGSSWLVALLGLALLLSPATMPLPAYAETPAEFTTMTKTVTGWDDDHQVEPGETFVYTITLTCTNTGSGGCTNAKLTDSLPAGLSLDEDASDITVAGASAEPTADGNDVTVTFTDTMTDPEDVPGLLAGNAVTIQIPVVVDEDIPPELNGQDLTNIATASADNADPKSDDFTVIPDVPIDLVATTDKAFDPDSAVANPGTETTMTLSGGNASSVPVDEIVITDPTDPPGPPGAFEHLALTGDLTVTLPPGAEEVQVDCYVDGNWINGPPSAPPAALSDQVGDPADCEGVRVHFISTDGGNIAPDASGSIDVGLEQRDNIADAGEGPINNEVSTTVTAGDDTSDPVTADDDYTIQSGDIDLDATKDFEPNTIAAGSTSTVTLGATNSSDLTLDSLTITEPGGDPNMFENGLTFSGWGDVQWPTGATGASVTYTYANPPSPVTESTTTPNTLPDPAPGRTVTGFTVTFTGPIVAGAEASIPFTVTADDEQEADEVEHPNTITADSSAAGGYEGDADANDTLTTIVKRLDIETGKRVLPEQIFSIPGQRVLVELSGHITEFPDSTTDANEIIVQDPADLDGDPWYDSFAPTGVVETPIPADATLTVQYWNGTEWVDVPGMVDLAGPQVFSGDFPPEVVENAQGIRFVYDSDAGFPPGTEVNPNIGFELKPEAAGQDLTVEDCASSRATAEDADPAAGDPACDDIVIVPPDTGNADFIAKAWDDPAAVGERTEEGRGATISWSTSGATKIDQMVISDVPDPDPADLPNSVFDSFDLVRIDPITPALDPHLTFDQVERVELFSAAANDWIDAPNDPCPAACDGTFPGYSLSAPVQADTIAFRLVYSESPTRADRIGDNPEAPPVGSGVAISTGNDREIHPVFRIRDELRSDPDDPVLADDVYNLDEAGVVRNTARARLVVGDNDDFYHQDASDDIAITPVNVTADITKDWTGGPLGVPEPGTASFPAEYPTGTVTLQGKNTTPRVVDRLTITEPTGGTDPFENFNLADFTTITDPAAIGATELSITLSLEGGGTRTLTRDEALAAAESELTDVVGFTVVYAGRIESNGTGVITFVTRVRDYTRSDPAAPVETPQTVADQASAEAEDLLDYPNVDPRTNTDTADASIDLAGRGIGLEVTKTFTPDSQTEPDRSPVNLALTGQPSGPSRTDWMQLVDEDTTFFNAYDFVDFGDFGFTAPIDTVQIDAYVGGTFAAAGGTVTRTGGGWVIGDPGTTPVLPDGVAADQV
ncbi:MAG: isopeptide-forming domain-containing fimbrial protein, partial [Microlunatus sp.]|nr:isopeptide-forming domain-containing fimbrial protein [Microlunatus sp.]